MQAIKLTLPGLCIVLVLCSTVVHERRWHSLHPFLPLLTTTTTTTTNCQGQASRLLEYHAISSESISATRLTDPLVTAPHMRTRYSYAAPQR